MSLPSISEVEEGNSILFLGAGFSSQAINLAGNRIKTVQELTEFLLKESGQDDPSGFDLESAAEEYLKFHHPNGESKLSNILHSNFVSENYTESQRTIVCQPWFRIYTTNYDDIVEGICKAHTKRCMSREIFDDVCAPFPGVSQLIHIYGNISRSSPEEFKKTFILSEGQRDNSPFLKSRWMRRFHDDVLSSKSIIFVGFSLSDIDIRRLLGSLPLDTKKKIHFITSPNPKPALVTRLSKFGNLHAIGSDAFAQHLGLIRPGPPIKRSSMVPHQMVEIDFSPQISKSVSAVDIERLLLTGEVLTEKLSESDISGNAGSYTISRLESSYIRARNNATGKRPILIHGDIGNGKTIFSFHIGYLFSKSGFRIFKVVRQPENTGEIISFFQSVQGNVLVIFDDIMRFSRLPSDIINIGRDDIIVLATVRSSALDTSRDRVLSRLDNSPVIEIDLNVSKRSESEKIIRYLDENGLFGSASHLSNTEKLHIVERKCSGQIRDIVLTIYQTGSLHQKVEDLLANIRNLNKSERQIIGLSAMLAFIGFDHLSRFSDLSDLTNYDGILEDLRDALVRNEIATMVRVESGDVSIRSPALAEFILRRVFDMESLLEISMVTLNQIDLYYRDDPEFVSLAKALLKFSTYGSFVRTERHNEIIDKFYADSRTFSFAEKDPLFWVQRSICCMNMNNFTTAFKFTETAYSLAARLKFFDTYQIQNHNAKLILTKSLYQGISKDGKDELQALNLLQSVLSRKSDDLYHPLSVMRLFADIADRWRGAMSGSQRIALKDAIDQATKLIAQFRQIDRFRNLPELKRRLASASSSLR
ncbi:SIR2 family protein [Xanthobacter aminoxidans]|uniref:SIR2 family protein n=1 Tax=Xanthobacter aminoxidans TaxID=186280 RepID=A0ABW6ZN05_9HYPH